MISKKSKSEVRAKKHRKIRGRLSGTPERPRLSVFRSNKHIYAQIIDDVAAVTLAAAGTSEKGARADLKYTDNIEAAKYVGDLIAKRALEKGIKQVVFDRGGFIYQGKIKALADSAREAGLEF